MPSVRVDTSNFNRRVEAMRAQTAAARTAFLRAIVGSATVRQMELAPKDTRRYVRGWGLAAIAIGCDFIHLPALQKSRYIEQYVEAYEAAIGWLAQRMRSIEAELRSNGGSAAWGSAEFFRARATRRRVGLSPSRRRRLENTVASLRARIAAKRAELRAFLASEHAIVIGAGPVYLGEDGTAGIAIDRRWTKPTVRLEVYGGTGMFRHGATRTEAVLTNKEPHASLVEFAASARVLRYLQSELKARQAYLSALTRGRSTRGRGGRSTSTRA